MNTLSLLIEQFRHAILKAFPILQEPVPVDIVQSTQSKFGHYQCNSAMKLSKILQQNPRAIAEAIVKQFHLPEQKMIAELSIAGPGFINITLTPEYIANATQQILNLPHLGIPFPKNKQRIVVDFSSPNIAKEMHVGHLRSTIIGDCIARLYEFLGHDVLRLNHVGDWGTAFGMLIAYIKQEHPEVLTGKQKTDLSHLMKWYKLSKQKFDADAAFKRSAQQEVVALQQGNKDSLNAWKIICHISEEAYQQVYNLLDVRLKTRGESFYNPMLADLVADVESKGLVTVSDGAKCIFLEGFQNREGEALPLMIQKSDGGYNYDTTDLAALRHRIEAEKANQVIYVVDAGQSTHFQMIFKAAEKAGYLNPTNVRVVHVPFGLVLGQDGKKFRTRSGETERLIDLLDTAIKEADQILEQRSPEMKQEERLVLAKALGIGAVKYADLSCHRTGDYTFSYERMLRFEGNTAAFLMYAYVRTLGIKRKVGVDVSELQKKQTISLKHPSEVALGLQLIQFSETLDQVADELLPNRLTDYLYTLAEKFNAFFRDCRVEGSEEQNSRLLLAESASLVLKKGLEILGLQVVNQM